VPNSLWSDPRNIQCVSCAEMQDKVADLMSMFDKIKTDTEEREKALEVALNVSEKFWDDLNGVMVSLKDLHETLQLQEQPALDPSIIREQQDVLEVRLVFLSVYFVIGVLSVLFARQRLSQVRSILIVT